MNVNFEYYRIFYMVAKKGNITKAANELNISQPAISKSIKNLEQQLGGTLFIRTKRGVVLTEEGKEFYRYIEQAMEFINNAENKFSDLIHLETGTIRIGVSTTLTKQFLLPYLETFHKLYPKIKIQIVTNFSLELIERLRNGLLDLLILNLPNSSGNDIEIIEVKRVQDCFIVGESYKELVKNKMTLEEITNYPLVLQSKGSATRNFLDDFCAKRNITLQPDMNLTSYSLVVEFTKIGFGIGYATRDYIKEELNSKKVFELSVSPAIPSRGIGIAYSRRNLPNYCTKKFIDIIFESESKKDNNIDDINLRKEKDKFKMPYY